MYYVIKHITVKNYNYFTILILKRPKISYLNDKQKCNKRNKHSNHFTIITFTVKLLLHFAKGKPKGQVIFDVICYYYLYQPTILFQIKYFRFLSSEAFQVLIYSSFYILIILLYFLLGYWINEIVFVSKEIKYDSHSKLFFGGKIFFRNIN